jgi:uncharacterized membrane protein YkvA (DUF1232 family)
MKLPKKGAVAAENAPRDSDFWRKVRKVAGRIPFAPDIVALWYCAADPATPLRVRATIWGAIAYFVLPIDLVPDVIAGLGFTDDAAVVAAVLGTVAVHVKPQHRDAARRALLLPEPLES